MIGENEILTARNDEHDQIMAKRVQTGGSPHVKAGTGRIHRNSDGSSLAKEAVFGHPDVVIRLIRKTRLVGRRVVTVAVSLLSSPPPLS
jgi:hypothetical protein